MKMNEFSVVLNKSALPLTYWCVTCFTVCRRRHGCWRNWCNAINGRILCTNRRWIFFLLYYALICLDPSWYSLQASFAGQSFFTCNFSFSTNTEIGKRYLIFYHKCIIDKLVIYNYGSKQAKIDCNNEMKLSSRIRPHTETGQQYLSLYDGRLRIMVTVLSTFCHS